MSKTYEYKWEWDDADTICRSGDDDRIVAASPEQAAWELAEGADYDDAAPCMISEITFNHDYNPGALLATATVWRGHRKYTYYFSYEDYVWKKCGECGERLKIARGAEINTHVCDEHVCDECVQSVNNDEENDYTWEKCANCGVYVMVHKHDEQQIEPDDPKCIDCTIDQHEAETEEA
jgi:rRNA maturation protein Nop10